MTEDCNKNCSENPVPKIQCRPSRSEQSMNYFLENCEHLQVFEEGRQTSKSLTSIQMLKKTLESISWFPSNSNYGFDEFDEVVEKGCYNLRIKFENYYPYLLKY